MNNSLFRYIYWNKYVFCLKLDIVKIVLNIVLNIVINTAKVVSIVINVYICANKA